MKHSPVSNSTSSETCPASLIVFYKRKNTCTRAVLPTAIVMTVVAMYTLSYI